MIHWLLHSWIHGAKYSWEEERQFQLAKAAIALRGIARSNGLAKDEAYWDSIAEDLFNKNIHSDRLTPDIFKESEE